jgi:glycosyltransferase involved in cell wall biosynthesis
MKHKQIKISVIIPVLNQEKYIGRCLRSILSQSFEESFYEIIVIDDGSDDYTVKILEAFSDKIKIISHKKNLGLPSALNSGIKNAKGKYIVRIDSDDYVNFDYLNILYLFIEHNNYDAVGCDYYLVNDKEEILEKRNCLEYPIGCGIIFRIDQLIDIGMYDKNFLINEEVELRKRFEKKYSVERVPLPLYRYRQHLSNMTKKNEI